MNLDYYNNLLGKLRDAFTQCPRDKPRMIKVDLTKEQIEDLFNLWKDEAYKRWGLIDRRFTSMTDAKQYLNNNKDKIIIVDESFNITPRRDRYRKEIADYFKRQNKNQWIDRSGGKPEIEYNEITGGQRWRGMKIPIEYIIEIGMLRKRNKCALCNTEIKNIPNHNIQLCLRCRNVEFKKMFAKEVENE